MLNVAHIFSALILVIAALLSITTHEFFHGFAAYRLGDNTAKAYGRLSLNPLKHIDWFGALCLVFFKFGWAKPVPINPTNFRNYKKGLIIVSLAGPLSNFVLAFVCMFIYYLIYSFSGIVVKYISEFLSVMVSINLGLFVFNLIPIPPLDGSKVLSCFLRGGNAYKYLSFEKYGPVILLLCLWIPFISRIFSGSLSFVVSQIITLFDIIIKFIIGVF